MERYLMLAATTVVFVVVGLAISLAGVIYGYQSGMLKGSGMFSYGVGDKEKKGIFGKLRKWGCFFFRGGG